MVKALGGDPRHFARDEDTADEPVPRKKIARALRDVVTYRLWADLKRGWRITMPNLEQTGQLRLAYFGLDELAAERRQVGSVWAATGRRRTRDTALPDARPARRDCVATCASNRSSSPRRSTTAIKRASQEWLKVPWALSDETGIYSGTAYPGGRPKCEPGVGGDLYVSGLGAYGRWLRRHDRFPLHDHPLKPADAETIIEALIKVMADAGILARIQERNRRTGYRIQASLIEWHAGTGEYRAPDPIRGNQTKGRVNPYFNAFLRRDRPGVGRTGGAGTHRAGRRRRNARNAKSASARPNCPVLVLLTDDGTRRRHQEPQRGGDAQCPAYPGELRSTFRAGRPVGAAGGRPDLLRDRKRPRRLLFRPQPGHGGRCGSTAATRTRQSGPGPRTCPLHLAGRLPISISRPAWSTCSTSTNPASRCAPEVLATIESSVAPQRPPSGRSPLY